MNHDYFANGSEIIDENLFTFYYEISRFLEIKSSIFIFMTSAQSFDLTPLAPSP